ncbi:hypothetical protein F4859DRAFT_510945 [Xylaria cf. heliscus]|nr:hypothetical protein F4859DRAFT_510945 [Xylaria cf. heliscus]
MESLTKLDMRPDDDQGQDASAWRERLALSKMDECSNHVFKMYQHKAEERGQLKLLYKDTARKRRVRVAENGVAATIIADTDLVTFRFNYGITQTSMIMLERGLQNKNIFAGISKVGIEIELLRDGYKHTPRFKPFWFPCHHGNAHPPGACWNGVVKFLRWFENLEVVYIIIQITWRDISVVRTLLSYAPPPPPSRRPDQVPVGVVAHMRDLGQRMNLEQFHDQWRQRGSGLIKTRHLGMRAGNLWNLNRFFLGIFKAHSTIAMDACYEGLGRGRSNFNYEPVSSRYDWRGIPQ